MAAQKGRDFVLKLGTAAAGTAIAAMRTTSFTLNGTTVDVTNKDSGGFRELLAGGGISSMSVSAEGVLTAADDTETLEGYVLDRTLNAFGLVFDGGDKIDASFQVTSFQAAGNHDGEQTYSISLESSGTITITAAA